LGVKVLVVGFPRSGTTLTYRTCKKHPQMAGMFNEEHIIRSRSSSRFQFTTKNYLCNKYPKFKLNHGDKLIYEKRVIGKRHLSNITVVEYCEKWNELFGSDARIIQIVRHPLDSWNSIIKMKYRKRGKMKQIPRMIDEYITYIPKYTEMIADLKSCLTIKYENMVSNFKEISARIYEHCNLDPFNYSEPMRVGRIFNHRKNGFILKRVDSRFNDVIKVFNKFDGPVYEIGDYIETS